MRSDRSKAGDAARYLAIVQSHGSLPLAGALRRMEEQLRRHPAPVSWEGIRWRADSALLRRWIQGINPEGHDLADEHSAPAGGRELQAKLGVNHQRGHRG
jgi:hypothetical protein